MHDFKENDVVYWVMSTRASRRLGVAVCAANQDDPRIVRFKAWKFTDKEYRDSFGDGWIKGNPSAGIELRYAFKHKRPARVWAEYVAAELIGEISDA